jgi:hypothetical protein
MKRLGAIVLVLVVASGIAAGHTKPRLRSHRSKHLVRQQAERTSPASTPEPSELESPAVPVSVLLLVLTGLVAIAVAAFLGLLLPAHQGHLRAA